MKRTRCLLCSAVLGLFSGCLSGGPDQLEEHNRGTITTPQTFGLRNVTVFRVDPAGAKVRIDWRGYNVRTGSAFRVPYEVIRLSADGEEYVVSDQGTGNNALMVNGVLHQFDSESQQVLIRFGEGVSLEPGGDYRAAIKQYEADFQSP